ELDEPHNDGGFLRWQINREQTAAFACHEQAQCARERLTAAAVQQFEIRGDGTLVVSDALREVHERPCPGFDDVEIGVVPGWGRREHYVRFAGDHPPGDVH